MLFVWIQHNLIGVTGADNIYPQAQEQGGSTQQYSEAPAPDTADQQNVHFVDTNPGYMEMRESFVDNVRDAPMNEDASLGQFFSRPIKIRTLQWGVGTTLYDTFNPWNLFFTNPRVINRIANYKLMRCKLHVKFVLNGTPFHYGRLIVSYNPLPGFDDMTIDRAFIPSDVVAASQRPHVYLNPTCSIGSEMVLPFFLHYNLIDVVAEDWAELGELTVHSMQLLKHANGASDSVSISVFAWAEDVNLAVPTNYEPGSIAPQADEYSSKVLSQTATALANVASNFTNIPVIGPWMRATQMGAGAMSAIAQAFGYCKPPNLESSVFKPITKNSLALTNVTEDIMRLSVDAKQELCVDPRTVGLDNSDEMAILNIAKRESWVTSFDWPLGANEESLLFNILVDPCVFSEASLGPQNELHFPACCFAALPFQYWRGTMRYRFQVVCSNFHKGRLKFVYDPTGTAIGPAEYNTAYTTIVDISDNTDFTIDVGWGQRTTYREHISPGVLSQEETMGSAVVLATTPFIPYGNGSLAVYVVNELTVPNTTIDNDIQINVFVSALDDFEVAVPDADIISSLRLTTESQLQPQAEEMEQQDSIPVEPPTLAAMGSSVSTTDQTQLLHFGEKITSFRQMLKRYDFHEFLPLTDLGSSNRVGLHYVRNAFPYYPGYTSSGGNLSQTLAAGEYLFSNMTLLNYVTSAYGGWRGSIRYFVNFEIPTFAGRNQCSVVRDDFAVPDNIVTVYSNSARTPAGQAELLENRRNYSAGYNGEIVQVANVNSTVAYELPYYSQNRFTPAKRRNVLTSNDTLQNKHIINFDYITVGFEASGSIPVHVATGEDFALFFYLGPPIFYREVNYPAA